MNFIVYITDERYAMPTCVSIQSLIENRNSKCQYSIYVLAFELSENSIRHLSSIVAEGIEVTIMEMNRVYSELYKNSVASYTHVSEAALCKFELPNIFPDLEKILYVDGDIIFNGDLSKIFEIDISDVYLAAVDDMGDSYTNGVSVLASRIYLPEQRYFNSGFMYLNLEKMRKDHVPEKLILYKEKGINYFVDQDALNVVLGKKRYSLPYVYNFRASIINELDLAELGLKYEEDYNSIEECLIKQVTLHMTDKMKPWQYNMPWLTDIFKYYYNKSVYKDEMLQFENPLRCKNQEIAKLSDDVMALNNDIAVLNDKWKKARNREKRAKCWRFPVESISPDSRIVLYGAGKVGKDFYDFIQKTRYCQLIAWVDAEWEKIGQPVVSLEQIRNLKYDKIIIAIYQKEMAEQIRMELVNKGIRTECIVLPFDIS